MSYLAGVSSGAPHQIPKGYVRPWQARPIQGKFCVSQREISLGKNRFARNGGGEETLAKPHGHAIAIRGSNAEEAAFLESMLRKERFSLRSK